MAKSPNLQLELFTDAHTNGEQWVKSQNYEYSNGVDKSNAQVVDEWAGQVETRLDTLENADYDDLTDIPIVNADLNEIEPVANTYYRHIGETVASAQPSNNFENGKIYYYDGTDYVDITQGGSSGLPPTTSADSGKFLRVDASGNWVAETVPSAEESSF